MNQTVGFIGCGKMAQAMIGGMIHSKIVTPDQIIASAQSEGTLEEVRRQFEIQTNLDNRIVAGQADLLFLAVKPYDYKAVIHEVRQSVADEAIIITIAPGVSFEEMESAFEREMKVVQAMPNTPSLVEAGMSALCPNSKIDDKDLAKVITLFESFGKVEVITESQMSAIPSISGSSPAYVYMMIEAMADGGVAQGLSRDQSYRLAAQAVLGAAKMVLDTGKHPGELKDEVTSPGGATIAAVTKLEQERFRGTIMAAMESCSNKVKDMGEE
ncbi:pyrroline-5-carboxylate reductase [Pontibacillus yanchengensis]|uniref:Pyrroline-5-carboxylate reductase n=2 Tax=Pontibacillus yanchengensis TaxID=462910 RepID=A0ACC7VI14_9BACI|nr:pyrroline-5-carboxylate reductase [Pontibacillus yanchengensis]MYL34550.1 pyrroline-5-carboxylate reductase [Pontibacillus yanchengensis]MYL54417.1 pyrroline-5-carboxylate reductase [Pontibacillus yanchengensis]